MNRVGIGSTARRAGGMGGRAGAWLCALLVAWSWPSAAQEAAVRERLVPSRVAWESRPAYIQRVALARAEAGTGDVLTVVVADAPPATRLCVEWLDAEGGTAREDCQAVQEGGQALRFVGPAIDAGAGRGTVARISAQTQLRALAGGTPQVMRSMARVEDMSASAAMAAPPPPPPPPPAPSAPPPATGSAASPADPSKPKGFPWPPPDPTSRASLDHAMLQNTADPSLGGAARKLQAALESVGYVERSYYPVPGGFALVTRLEQIDPKGKPVAEPDRWSMTTAPRKLFSPADFLRVLFTAPEGNYRVIAFVVSDQPFRTTDTTVSAQDAEDWLDEGLDRLPPALARQAFTDDHGCTALVYQFRKTADDDPVANPDGATPALTQLTNSGILAALAR